MSDSKQVSRREMLAGIVRLTVLAAPAAWLVTGCDKKKELSCTDTSALSADEKQARDGVSYVDKSIESGKNCENCAQFKPGAADQCGSCNVVKGPINPAGYCKIWAAKPA